MPERSEDCISARKYAAVGINQNNGRFKLLAVDFGKAVAQFLGLNIINRSSGDLPPTFNPSSTEMTFAIPDDRRLGRRIGDAQRR